MKHERLILIFFTLFSIQAAVAQEVSVLTYNIKFATPNDSLNSWEHRKGFLTAQLRFYGPDVFGTQEGLIGQLREIAEALPDYKFVGTGRDFGDTRGEHTALFYNTRRVKLLEQGTFWLSETPGEPSKGWDAALPRICTYGVFKMKGSGKTFLVLNTHFDHIGEIARTESARLLLEKIKALNPKDYPVILMGDLNLEPDKEGIQLLKKELEDTHETAGARAFGPEGTFNGFRFTEPVTRRIDYIFTGKGDFKVIKSGILSDSKGCRYPSDHFPVYAELDFN